MANSIILFVLSAVFLLAVCQGDISLFSRVFRCNESARISCRFSTATYVQVQQFKNDTSRFNPLTPCRIDMIPDYQAMEGEGVDGGRCVRTDDQQCAYHLTIMNVRKYNGSRYRCHGFEKDGSDIYSDEQKILITGNGDCLSLKMNGTDNITLSDNGTMQATPIWVYPVAVFLAPLVVLVVLRGIDIVTAACIAVVRLKCKGNGSQTDNAEGRRDDGSESGGGGNDHSSSLKLRAESCV